MPIKIIKRVDAPKLPRPDEVVRDPVCNYVQEKPTREGFDGPEFDDMPKLWRCLKCGELFKSPYWDGKPVSESPMWTHKQ
jgi:hypothetical protein